MAADRDAVVIGGGHNGLVAANFLARAGLRVLVAERAAESGGACVTDEVAPGFHVSTAAYVSGLFRPRIIEELELNKFGLQQIAFDPQAFCPFPDGKSLRLWKDAEKTSQEIARFSKKDAVAYPKYEALWSEVYDLVEPMLLAPSVPLAELASLLRDSRINSFPFDRSRDGQITACPSKVCTCAVREPTPAAE